MFYPEVHFSMEASLRWSGAESQSDPRIAVNGTLYLLRAPTNVEWHAPIYVTLEVGNQTFTRMRHTPQLNWRLSPNPASHQNSGNLQGWGTLHNSIGGSQQIPAALKATKMTTSV